MGLLDWFGGSSDESKGNPVVGLATGLTIEEKRDTYLVRIYGNTVEIQKGLTGFELDNHLANLEIEARIEGDTEVARVTRTLYKVILDAMSKYNNSTIDQLYQTTQNLSN